MNLNPKEPNEPGFTVGRVLNLIFWSVLLICGILHIIFYSVPKGTGGEVVSDLLFVAASLVWIRNHCRTIRYGDRKKDEKDQE